MSSGAVGLRTSNVSSMGNGMMARTWGIAVGGSSSSTAATRMVGPSTWGDVWRRGATKKTGGSSKNGRTSRPKYLGPKRGDGEEVKAGEILLRQRGTRIHPGPGVERGRDHTLYATTPGVVSYTTSHYPVPDRRLLCVVPLSLALPRRIAVLRARPSQL